MKRLIGQSSFPPYFHQWGAARERTHACPSAVHTAAARRFCKRCWGAGMLVPREDFDATYARVKEGAASGGCTVLIFVAPDVDALCACRIFTVSCAALNPAATLLARC